MFCGANRVPKMLDTCCWEMKNKCKLHCLRIMHQKTSSWPWKYGKIVTPRPRADPICVTRLAQVLYYLLAIKRRRWQWKLGKGEAQTETAEIERMKKEWLEATGAIAILDRHKFFQAYFTLEEHAPPPKLLISSPCYNFFTPSPRLSSYPILAVAIHL